MTTYLFDIGNVLLRFDFTVAAQRFAALSEANACEVLTLLAPFKDALESGRLSDEDFVEQSMHHIGFRGTKEDFVRIWGDIFEVNAPMLQLIPELAERSRLYLLSNTSGLHKRWIFDNYAGLFKHFSGGVYSHEARSAKPEEPIFQLVLESFGMNPAETIYIDDLADNIATGRRLGLRCFHYHPSRHEDLVGFLREWAADGNG